jgi:hypothetical protein
MCSTCDAYKDTSPILCASGHRRMPKCCALQKFRLGVSLSLLEVVNDIGKGPAKHNFCDGGRLSSSHWLSCCSMSTRLMVCRCPKTFDGARSPICMASSMPTKRCFRPSPPFQHTPTNEIWSCSQITSTFVPTEVGHSTSNCAQSASFHTIPSKITPQL